MNEYEYRTINIAGGGMSLEHLALQFGGSLGAIIQDNSIPVGLDPGSYTVTRSYTLEIIDLETSERYVQTGRSSSDFIVPDDHVQAPSESMNVLMPGTMRSGWSGVDPDALSKEPPRKRMVVQQDIGSGDHGEYAAANSVQMVPVSTPLPPGTRVLQPVDGVQLPPGMQLIQPPDGMVIPNHGMLPPDARVVPITAQLPPGAEVVPLPPGVQLPVGTQLVKPIAPHANTAPVSTHDPREKALSGAAFITMKEDRRQDVLPFPGAGAQLPDGIDLDALIAGRGGNVRVNIIRQADAVRLPDGPPVVPVPPFQQQAALPFEKNVPAEAQLADAQLAVPIELPNDTAAAPARTPRSSKEKPSLEMKLLYPPPPLRSKMAQAPTPNTNGGSFSSDQSE